jgi:RNase P/RNase MRP subunit p29
MSTLTKALLGLAVIAVLAVAAHAAAPKTYQVTGPIVSMTGDMIVVDKDGDKWEIARNADTKVMGNLKVGAKVTIQYRMTATRIEAK